MTILRAVVFDLDGTLCDSAPDIAAALNGTLHAAGYVPFDLATVTSMVGGGAHTLIERALTRQGVNAVSARVAALLEDFLARYRAESCVRTRLYPGARETLEACAATGLKLAICTNKPTDLTALVLDGLGIGRMFASVVAATPVLPPKPAPDMLLAVLAVLGVRPAEAVMVGDSAADAGVARAAGVQSVLLRHGYSAEPVDTLGAGAVVDGFAELAAHLGLDSLTGLVEQARCSDSAILPA